jgi:mannosyl-glycoprotein endo-beta-N-acetylglucosaminidase
VIEVLYTAIVSVEDGSTLNLRKKASTSSDILARIPKNEKIDVIEISGDWSKVIYNNINGYVMNKYLIKINKDEEEGEKVFYVRIKCASAQEAT